MTALNDYLTEMSHVTGGWAELVEPIGRMYWVEGSGDFTGITANAEVAVGRQCGCGSGGRVSVDTWV